MKRNLRKILLAGLIIFMPSTLLAEQITVTVKGMVCSFCAQGIKKTFGKQAEVKSIDVDLDMKTVLIGTQPEKSLSDDVIKKTINDAGYEVVTIEREKDV